MNNISIRPAQAGDYDAILGLTYEAFLTLDYPGRRRMDEHFLIHLLQGSAFVIAELCFVAELYGEVVGHILYTRSKILRADGTETETITFGPLSVLPKFHRQGIGAALVAHSMRAAKALGFGAVLIVGVPAYYPKLGFRRARECGVTLEDGSSPDELMVYELSPEYLSGGGQVVFLPPEFARAETDDAGYAAFHVQFMKERFEGQLVLRPFWEADIALMERWLFVPHVAKWYLHPADWLHELKNRHGEFGFCKHFIVELAGMPIGFCQYYDCFAAQPYEVWNEAWRVDERQGAVFSIDYLIGEPACLRKGYGKEIVRQLVERIRALGARRIIVQPDGENVASKGALEANGFRYVGEDFVKEL